MNTRNSVVSMSPVGRHCRWPYSAGYTRVSWSFSVGYTRVYWPYSADYTRVSWPYSAGYIRVSQSVHSIKHK